MKLSEIKRIAVTYPIEQLKQAEADILAGKTPEIEVNGEDDGEKLTHILASIDVITLMNENQLDLNAAVRKFSERVRSSIS